VRTDTHHRGKGYALDWGVKDLHGDPPDVVIIIDADCEAEAGSLHRLATLSAVSGRPAQASYLMDLPEAPSLKLRVAAFAWLLKTQLRALGYHRLGLPCQLMGTGMAFPWGLIRNAPLASGNIVEDVQLGVDLALAGHAPVFCPQAVVRSWFPTQGTAVQTQRTRWEHGHLNTLRMQVPRLLSAALGARGRQRTELAAMAWDLSVPPLAFLTLLLVASFSANAAVWLAQASVAGVTMSALGLAALAVVIAIAWHRMGRAAISPLQLLSVPLYVVAKIPMYLRLLLGRGQTDWVRTDRKKRRP
jgi:cellulose synthase/poly-beta-1,6-N-acetylglucosamine synthase-like glycosyltransferase